MAILVGADSPDTRTFWFVPSRLALRILPDCSAQYKESAERGSFEQKRTAPITESSNNRAMARTIFLAKIARQTSPFTTAIHAK
jgi:hypothetical protein